MSIVIPDKITILSIPGSINGWDIQVYLHIQTNKVILRLDIYQYMAGLNSLLGNNCLLQKRFSMLQTNAYLFWIIEGDVYLYDTQISTTWSYYNNIYNLKLSEENKKLVNWLLVYGVIVFSLPLFQIILFIHYSRFILSYAIFKITFVILKIWSFELLFFRVYFSLTCYSNLPVGLHFYA